MNAEKPTIRELVLMMLSEVIRRGGTPKLLLVHPEDVPGLPTTLEMGPIELQIDGRTPVGHVFVISARFENDEEFEELKHFIEQGTNEEFAQFRHFVEQSKKGTSPTLDMKRRAQDHGRAHGPGPGRVPYSNTDEAARKRYLN